MMTMTRVESQSQDEGSSTREKAREHRKERYNRETHISTHTVMQAQRTHIHRHTAIDGRLELRSWKEGTDGV